MTIQPWNRQRDPETNELEPMLWFDRFNTYRRCGPGRFLLSAQNEHRVKNGNKKYNSISGSWTNAHQKWNWKKRAEAYDLAEMERIEAEYKAACDAWARERFEFARKLMTKAGIYIAFPAAKQTRTVDEHGVMLITEPLPPKYAKEAASIAVMADGLARTTTRETLPKTEIAGETSVTITIQKVAGFDNV